jgi:hypothetical protein
MKDTVPQDALEVLRIMWRQHLGFARQIEIV